MKRPCDNCPFLRAKMAAFAMAKARKREIASSLRRGQMFPCHKTVAYSDDDDGRITSKSRFCGGALATMENEGGAGCMKNQMARISARLGMFNPDELEGRELVFGSLSEWVKHDSSGDDSAPEARNNQDAGRELPRQEPPAAGHYTA